MTWMMRKVLRTANTKCGPTVRRRHASTSPTMGTAHTSSTALLAAEYGVLSGRIRGHAAATTGHRNRRPAKKEGQGRGSRMADEPANTGKGGDIDDEKEDESKPVEEGNGRNMEEDRDQNDEDAKARC
ncbi:hypothetical protein MTO96_025168 [Rhipicephalus appendiculatus]